MNQHILVVLPHPDDECFGLAGTLAQHVKQGDQVTYACLTLGEMGRNMGVPPFANRVSLPQIRKMELEASCSAIGIQDLRMLGFHDKTIEFEDFQTLDGTINAIIQEVRPSRIYTFYPGYSVHPDHDACGAAVIRTVGKLAESERPQVYCMAFSKNHEEAIGQPNVFHDVSSFLKPKVASIQAHRSQFQVPGLHGNVATIPNELKERFGTERFWIYPFA
ncbi:bacillithiol biosynthesis deacetylase BshB2 [Paenibacillus aestuarii]|uniref:Bacillithiol biosynthesis deacetylase BshB2 n=1 Tax=Paenibacillus aestuarii TaxID=516965 RepID=A0ABW0K5K8_9BACL|nr:bacillithiol biosynthesis deacetylase BshB2 [Paenibacillus aestuarii]